jgi:hypothetical protein
MARSTSDPNQFGEWLKANMDDVGVNINLVVDEAVTDGAVVMREIIMSTGTNKDWGSSWPSRAFGRKSSSTEARYDTGEMLNSVKSAMLEVSPRKSSGVFGWLNNQQDYFIYQDKGFTHWISGDKIPAMNALREGYSHAISIVEKRLKEIFK